MTEVKDRQYYADRVSKELRCEVVVLGSGPSGLVAAVQAKELGLDVMLLEGRDVLGGNGSNTEGVFGVGSHFQKELGIEIGLNEVISEECKTFNYHTDALMWKDLFLNSGDNIEWLYRHGVGFSGVVDECKGYAKIKPFHWFHKRESDGRGDGYLLVNPLIEAAKALGIPILTNTRGVHLLTENDRVVGVYAVNTETDEVSLIRSGAVILATGGFADNDEMMTERGFNVKYVFHRGYPGHYGDGIRMAAAVGAQDVSRMRGYLDKLYIYPLNPYSTTTVWAGMRGLTLWVNNDGERFVDENCGLVDQCFCGNALRTQPKVFTVFDSAFVDSYKTLAKDLERDIEALQANEERNCFVADSIEELAAQSGISAEVLCQTVARYNSLCAQKRDDDFGKDPEKLLPILKAPFTMIRLDMGIWASIGGVKTNRKFEVVDNSGKAIPGLYCVGVEGCELYRDCYTHTVPGSANGNNVNSGRTASFSAYAYLRGHEATRGS